MKDKLVQTGHGKGYYRLKSIFVGFLFLLSVFALSATPVAITYAATAKQGEAEAKEEATSEVVEEDSEEDESLSYPQD